ncbi:MAG: hypothetical protein IJW59_00475 [Clostridia bacterium]|nr:hypothetical protein [Clostridia bacterium]
MKNVKCESCLFFRRKGTRKIPSTKPWAKGKCCYPNMKRETIKNMTECGYFLPEDIK